MITTNCTHSWKGIAYMDEEIPIELLMCKECDCIGIYDIVNDVISVYAKVGLSYPFEGEIKYSNPIKEMV